MKVFTLNDSSPEFLELQITSFRKYMQEDFEFIVFNGGETLGTHPEKAKEVSKICRSLSVQVVDVQRDSTVESARSRNPQVECGRLFGDDGRYTSGIGGHACNYMLQWAWERVISKEQGPICLCHSDVFLMEPIKLTNYLQDYSLCFKPIGPFSHMWEAFLLANMPKLPRPETIVWWPSFVKGVWTDTGGSTYYYLREHPELKYWYIGLTDVSDDPAVNFHPSRYQFFELGDKKVFHYLAGSRWFTLMPEYKGFSVKKSNEYHREKLAWTRNLIGIAEPQ